ncbi:24539_t:CDS:2, partial [Gigaspora rosea]
YDVADLIKELRTMLSSTNYHKYGFYQGLSLYSVIKEDGTQQIKVFNDIRGPSTIDCQVINIDDKPAIDKQLPKNQSISYTLNCNDKIFKINKEWQIPIKPLPQYKSPYIHCTSVGKAKLIFDAFIARCYILKDFGVFLISTESVAGNALEYRYITDIIFGFELLANKGIKKIVLDLTNNRGGKVEIAHIINKILFPNIQSFPVYMKVNNISIQIIEGFPSIKSIVGSVQVKYISKAFFNDTALYEYVLSAKLKLPTPPKLPWSEEDIIILTNG